MERAAALKKLGKLLGKGFRYGIDNSAPSPEARAAAAAMLPSAIAGRNNLIEQLNERRAVLLAADAEYQKLLCAVRDARADAETLSARARHFKITVGVTNGLFLSVKAQGDSWEHIFQQLKAKV